MYKLRRTMMFVPGNNAGMVRDANIYGADALMFDLEDSVSIYEKDSARLLVYNALKTIDYEGTERVVRINALDSPYGMEDIEAIVRARPDVIRLPKTETAKDVIDVQKAVESVEKSRNTYRFNKTYGSHRKCTWSFKRTRNCIFKQETYWNSTWR